MKEYLVKALKEGRTNAKLKQSEVALKLGVKGGTLSNYENGVSEPDIDTFAKLCTIYNLNAADLLYEAYGLGAQENEFRIRQLEINHIKKYRELDTHGKEMVDFTLEKEWERSKESESHKVKSAPLYSYLPMQDSVVAEPVFPYGINAAHERTDIEITDEMRQHDDNIMDDENF